MNDATTHNTNHGAEAMTIINSITDYLNNNGPASMDAIIAATGCSFMDIDDAAGRVCRAAVIKQVKAPAGQSGRWFEAL